jgi:glycosyltransferase involved in cell wall biosynthesis
LSANVLVVIPALNADRTVERVVRDARELVQTVVVVDDGSTDRTAEIARDAGAIVLRHETNRGKGGALKTAFAYALANGFTGVISLDADGQHLPAELPKFIAAARETGADLIIGSRAHLFAGMRRHRRLANRFSSWAISRGSGARIEDSQSGFRYYSAAMVRAIPYRSEGFDFESEAIVRAVVRGYRVVSIPVSLGFIDGLATSHFRPVVDIARILRTAVLSRFVWR